MFLTSGAISAGEPDMFSMESAFKDGTDKYESGDFDSAIASFKSIMDNGYLSGNILYNIGNAYLKSGKLGYAILSYEKAKLYIPRDIDLISNLDYAKSLIKQKESYPARHILFSLLSNVLAYLTLGESYFILMFIYYVLSALIILGIFFPGIKKYLIPIIIIFVVSAFDYVHTSC